VLRKAEWHRWFAWHPVAVKTYPDGSEKMIWWEPVLRRGELQLVLDGVEWVYEYKEIEGDD